MERSDSLIKLVSVVAFLAIAVYMVTSFIGGREDPLRLQDAVGFEICTTAVTEGFIVRDERVITASGNIAVTAAEGARVAAGETVAVEYKGSSAMERADRIKDIRTRINQLSAIRDGKSSSELAFESVLELSGAVSSGDLSELYSIESDIDTYIISSSAMTADEAGVEIARLQTELNELLLVAESDTVRISSPVAGTFSENTDGLEYIYPKDLGGLTPQKARELYSLKYDTSDAVGKVARGIKWYYVTVMDEEDTVTIEEGRNVTVQFSKNYSAGLSMTVESVSLPEDGECAVVLSCSKFLQDVVSLRDMTGEIVFGTLKGIRVQREAMHIDDKGTPYIYVLRGLQAEKVYVKILAEEKGYYLVSEDGKGLRAGDQIVLSAKNLYDGAVVVK